MARAVATANRYRRASFRARPLATIVTAAPPRQGGLRRRAPPARTRRRGRGEGAGPGARGSGPGGRGGGRSALRRAGGGGARAPGCACVDTGVRVPVVHVHACAVGIRTSAGVHRGARVFPRARGRLPARVRHPGCAGAYTRASVCAPGRAWP